MRRNQYQREVLGRLARIDSNLDKISRELAKMVEQPNCPSAVQPFAGGAAHQQFSLSRNASQNRELDREPDKWLQEGIDSIMSFQAGKKREGEQ